MRLALRPPPLLPGMPGRRDRAANRAPWDREQPAPGLPPLGRRAHAGVARPLPPLGHPLRTPRRHPPRLHDAGLRPRHTQPVQTVLLDALRRGLLRQAFHVVKRRKQGGSRRASPVMGAFCTRRPSRTQLRLCAGVSRVEGGRR